MVKVGDGYDIRPNHCLAKATMMPGAAEFTMKANLSVRVGRHITFQRKRIVL